MAARKSLVVLSGFLLVAACAVSQDRTTDAWQEQAWIRLDPVKWQAAFKLDQSFGTTESAGRTTESEETRLREGVRLQQTGYSLDPGILRFSVELEPTFEQSRFDADGRSERFDTKFLDYSLDLRALEATPGPFSYFANAMQSTGSNVGSLGTRNDFQNTRAGIGANWKSRAFPSTLEITHRSRDETYRAGVTNTATEIKEVERTARFRGHSSKMNVLAEISTFDDLIESTDRDRTVARLQVFNNYQWGKGSELRTDVDYFKRTDTQPVERLRLAPFARLQHTRDLYSTYEYEFFSSKQTTSTVRHSGNFTLNHKPYENLVTGFRVGVVAEDFEVGTEDRYETDLSFDYKKNIFWGGRLSAGLGGGFRLTDREATGGPVAVVDEPHRVDITRTFTLNERFIEVDTIVVTDVSGSIVFTEGADYVVTAISQSTTQIDTVAGGLINVGDTVLVSYQHAVLPTQKFYAIPYNYDINLDFGWIALFHSDYVDNEEPLSGTSDEFLFDRRQRTTGIELRLVRRALGVILRAEKRFAIAGDVESDSDVLTQSLSYTFTPRLSATLSASQSFTDTRDRAGVAADRSVDVYSADAGVNWRPSRGLSIRPFVGGWFREDKGVSDENFFGAGVDTRWRVGKLDMSLRINHDQRSGSRISPRQENRIMLNIIRRSM